MISQKIEKDENKILLFLGNPQQLQEACAEDKVKLDFLKAVETLLSWKAAILRAEAFLNEKRPKVRELEGQLWQQIADTDRREWPAMKILKTDGDQLTAVYAHRSGELSLEEVEIV